MNRQIFQNFQKMILNCTPCIIILLLILISITPFYVPEHINVIPLFALASIFHWAVYKPELLPPYAVFFIGLLQDMLQGMPAGVNTIVFLLVYGLVTSQNRFFFKKSFLVIWSGCGIILAASIILIWLLMCALNTTFIDPLAVCFEYAVTLGFYPGLAWCLLRWQRLFLSHV